MKLSCELRVGVGSATPVVTALALVVMSSPSTLTWQSEKSGIGGVYRLCMDSRRLAAAAQLSRSRTADLLGPATYLNAVKAPLSGQ